jgi:hypothetical protein
MNKQTRKTKLLDDGFITAPGYPFSARDIFGDLRSRLSSVHRHPMSFERLAKMLGRSKSTTYNWFDIFHHRMCLAFYACWSACRRQNANLSSRPTVELTRLWMTRAWPMPLEKQPNCWSC